MDKHVHQHAQKALHSGMQEPRPAHSKTTADPLAPRVVERLFVRLGSLYGHKWHSQFGSVDAINAAKADWALALAGFSLEQIGEGIRLCGEADDQWPPSLPQFRRLCSPQPEEGGLPPSLDEALALTIKRDWSTYPGVWQVVKRVGSYELDHWTEARICERVKQLYEELCIRVANGEVFAETPPAKSLPTQKTASRQGKNRSVTAKNSLAECFQMLGQQVPDFLQTGTD